MIDERRAHPRIPMRVQTEVRFTSWAVFSLIYTINISKGGMNLELPESPKIGDLLEVMLAPPDGPPVALQAVVRHTAPAKRGFSVGVEFQNLDDARRGVIERAIKLHGGSLTSGLTPRK